MLGGTLFCKAMGVSLRLSTYWRKAARCFGHLFFLICICDVHRKRMRFLIIFIFVFHSMECLSGCLFCCSLHCGRAEGWRRTDSQLPLKSIYLVVVVVFSNTNYRIFVFAELFFPLLHRGWIARHKHGNTCREVPALLRSSLFPVFFLFSLVVVGIYVKADTLNLLVLYTQHMGAFYLRALQLRSLQSLFGALRIA